MRAQRNRPRHAERGQSLTEFALVLPVLALLMLMALDFGRLFLGWVNLQNVARIGANFAAVNPDAWGSPGNATERARYETLIRNDAAAINCALPSALPTPLFPDGNQLGGRAEVLLTCDFDVLTPIISSVVGDPLSLGASAIFPIRAGTVAGIPVGSGPPPAAPVADFTATPRTGPAPLTVNFADQSTGCPCTYDWTFGDGGTSTDQNPVHQYAAQGDYAVSLTVTGTGGSDTVTRIAYISVTAPLPAAPVADFYGTPTSGASGGGPSGAQINGTVSTTVNFTDTSTGSPTSWAWTFGDGGTSTLRNPAHTYTTPGTYSVTLTASNAVGPNTLTRTAYVIVGCEVPNFAGTRRNSAQSTWSSRGFTTTVQFNPNPNGNWLIGSQSIPGGVVNPQPGGCDATITVSP